jgi:glycosyltransferase involved in cell wall biosynthesis
VSPHHSEGFGRGPAEALLRGVPVIATNYSGNVDFTTSETALVVDYKMVPVAEGEYPGVSGQFWAEIDICMLGQAMRRIAEDPETRQNLSKRGRQLMENKYLVAAVSVAYANRITDLLKDLMPTERAAIASEQVRVAPSGWVID